ncbi:MAG: hypothetical protein IJQ07_02875 [Clostridia bacterium]|nr:hypothetical protein [Clostridia bacterium]
MTRKIKVNLIVITIMMFVLSVLCSAMVVAKADFDELANKVNSANVYMGQGASVRVGTDESTMGLRYTLLIKNDDYNTLGNDVSYGMFFLPKDYVDIHPLDTDLSYYYWSNGESEYVDKDDNVLDASGKVGKALVVNFCNVQLGDSEDYTATEMKCFYGSLVNIKDGSDWHNFNIDREFIAIGYIKYINKSGNIVYKFANKIYSEVGGVAVETDFTYSNNSRSMAFVAQKAVDEMMEQIDELKAAADIAVGDEKTALENRISSLATLTNTLNAGYIGKVNGSYYEVSSTGDVAAEATEVKRAVLDAYGNPTGEYATYPTKSVSYTVEYYQEDDGEFNKVNTQVVNNAKLNDVVSIANAEEVYDGYVIDPSQDNLLSAKIYANRPVTLKAYYKPVESISLVSSELYAFCDYGHEGTDVYGENGTTTYNTIVDGVNADLTCTIQTQMNCSGHGGFVNVMTRFNLSSYNISLLQDMGYQCVSFDYYVGAEFIGDSSSSTTSEMPLSFANNDSDKVYYPINQWLNYDLNLSDLYTMVSNAENGINPYYYIIKLWETEQANYSVSIDNVTLSMTKSPKVLACSQVVETCDNGSAPNVGRWEKTFGQTVSGKTTQVSFSHYTRDMGYGNTYMTANFDYNVSAAEVQAIKDSGKLCVSIEAYFGVTGTVIPVDELDISLLGANTSKSYETNQWLTFNLSIDDFKAMIANDRFTFKISVPGDGSEKTCGTYSISIANISYLDEIPLPTFELKSNSRVYEYCSNGQGPNQGNWTVETNQTVGGETALYKFSNNTRDMGYGNTTMTAYWSYTYEQSNVQSMIDAGNNFVKYTIYFGVTDTVATISTISVAIADNDATAKDYSTNTWLDIYVPLSDLKTIVGNGGYTFKLFPETNGNESTCGTYSISLKSMEFVEEKPLPELGLTAASYVHETCTNGGAPNTGNWSSATNQTVGGKTALYTFSNTTRDPGYGDTKMRAYLRYTCSQVDVQEYIDAGKNYIKYHIYFGVTDTVASITTLSVAFTDNDSTARDISVNEWIDVYIPLTNLKTIVGNGGYTFMMIPVTAGNESTCGTYSLSIASVSLVEDIVLPVVTLTEDSFVNEMCNNPSAPGNGYWSKDISSHTAHGKTVQASFSNTTRCMGYAYTTMVCNLKYNLTVAQIDELIYLGYSNITYEVYFGIEDTVAELSTLSVATMGVNENAQDRNINEWLTVSLSLTDLKRVISENDWTFRLFPVINGDESTCGTYSLYIANIGFTK